MANEIRSELRQADSSYSAVQYLDTWWTRKQANTTWQDWQETNSIDDFHSCPVCCFFFPHLFTSYHPYDIFLWLKTLKLAELDIQVWQGHKQLDPNICLVEVTPPVSPQAGIRPIPIIPPQRITGDISKIIKKFRYYSFQHSLHGIDGKQGAFRLPLGCPFVPWSHGWIPWFGWSYSVASQIPFGRSSSESQPSTDSSAACFWIIQWTHILLPEFVDWTHGLMVGGWG